MDKSTFNCQQWTLIRRLCTVLMFVVMTSIIIHDRWFQMGQNSGHPCTMDEDSHSDSRITRRLLSIQDDHTQSDDEEQITEEQMSPEMHQTLSPIRMIEKSTEQLKNEYSHTKHILFQLTEQAKKMSDEMEHIHRKANAMEVKSKALSNEESKLHLVAKRLSSLSSIKDDKGSAMDDAVRAVGKELSEERKEIVHLRREEAHKGESLKKIKLRIKDMLVKLQVLMDEYKLQLDIEDTMQGRGSIPQSPRVDSHVHSKQLFTPNWVWVDDVLRFSEDGTLKYQWKTSLTHMNKVHIHTLNVRRVLRTKQARHSHIHQNGDHHRYTANEIAVDAATQKHPLSDDQLDSLLSRLVPEIRHYSGHHQTVHQHWDEMDHCRVKVSVHIGEHSMQVCQSEDITKQGNIKEISSTVRKCSEMSDEDIPLPHSPESSIVVSLELVNTKHDQSSSAMTTNRNRHSKSNSIVSHKQGQCIIHSQIQLSAH